jgi:hypothetical protein
MRNFPHTLCPTADDLLAYERGTAGAELRERIDAHVATCADCDRVRASLRSEDVVEKAKHVDAASEGFLSYVRRCSPASVDALQNRLAEQQKRMARLLEGARPEPTIGQVWAARLHDTARGGAGPAKSPSGADFWGGSYETAFPFLVLVLDQYVSEALDKHVVNLVPVTGDARLAAEWSLVFGTPDSGIGSPIVIHIDFEQSANINCLDRYIGCLPERSGSELLRVARAWSRSETTPSDLAVGRLGQAEIRTRVEWQALDKWLSGSMRALYDSDLTAAAEVDEPLVGDGATPDSPTAPTGGASIQSPPRPTNPWLDHSRPAARVAESDPGRIAAFLSDPELHRLNSASEQSGSSPPQRQAAAVAEEFVGAVHEFLKHECDDNLQSWSKRHGVVLTWEHLRPYEGLRVPDLWLEERWQERLLGRTPHLSQQMRMVVRRLATAVYYFCDERDKRLAGETLTARAARAARPQAPSSGQKRKHDE